MRLIDADKLFPYGAVPFYQDDGFKTADRIYGIINDAPTIDAVQVVRCKDCIHWDTKTGICFNPAGLSASGVHTANNYCSSGKRKEIV